MLQIGKCYYFITHAYYHYVGVDGVDGVGGGVGSVVGAAADDD